MQVRTYTSTSHYLIDGDDEYAVDFMPDEFIDPFIRDEDGVRLVTYAVQDDDCRDYDWSEGVHFWQADPHHISPATREEAESSDHVFLVERYEHGLVRYALVGEASQVDRQWDVGVVGLIGIPNDFTDPEGAARSILAEYTDWCNGNVYGIVTERFTADNGLGWTNLNEGDACWGFIGGEYAQSVVNDGGY